MNYKNILCTVVYQSAKDYIREFFKSISQQTVKNFNLLIINDGLKNITEYEYLLHKADICFRILNISNKALTPALIRQEAIAYTIKKGYENFIFADCDDICMPTRIERTLTALNHSNIVFNDMQLIDEKSKIITKDSYYTNILDNNQTIKFEDLIDKNYIGFSNIGIKAKYLYYCLPIPKELIAVDWWVISNILLQTKKIYFINEMLTGYRQYNFNTVGVPDKINVKLLHKAIIVKKIHYKAMATKYKQKDKKIYKIFHEYYDKMINLQKYLNDKNKERKTIEFLNQYKKNYAWWEWAFDINKMERLKNEINKDK